MLSEAGYSVTVFVQDDSVADYVESSSGGVRLVRWNSNRNKLHGSLGYAARLSYGFADIVRLYTENGEKPDVIEAQDYLGIAYYLTQYKHLGYSFLQGIPILITLHSPAFVYLEYNRVPTYRFPDFWTGEMEKHAIKAADVLVSPTHFLVEEIGRFMDISDRRVTVLANPFIVAERPAVPAFTRNKIIYYGKLSPQKGSFELLEYFKGLWDNGFQQALHIVGGTDIVYHPEMQTMGQLVEQRYGRYIREGLLQMHGKISPGEIRDTLQDAHVILVPSIVDNLPYVVMETMSLGKVVLASVQGGQREMIEDGVSGFLFDHTKPGSFGEQLSRILGLTDEEVQRIGLAACQRVKEKYSFSTIGPQKAKIIEEAPASGIPDDHFPFLYQEDHNPEETSYGKERFAFHCDSLLQYGRLYRRMRTVGKAIHLYYWEILIVNDGSTDAASLQKLEQLAGWEGVRVLHQQNKGLALTRNEGAAAARGNFWLFWMRTTA